MTRDELRKVQAKLPLSASTVRRNLGTPLATHDPKTCRQASRSESQRIVEYEPLAETHRTALYSGRVSVGIVSYRTRLLDPDKLCATFFVDALRYCGAIPGDEPDKLDFTIRQEKVASKSLERTEIIVTPL